jgi:hypothetical protein
LSGQSYAVCCDSAVKGRVFHASLLLVFVRSASLYSRP